MYRDSDDDLLGSSCHVNHGVIIEWLHRYHCEEITSLYVHVLECLYCQTHSSTSLSCRTPGWKDSDGRRVQRILASVAPVYRYSACAPPVQKTSIGRRNESYVSPFIIFSGQLQVADTY